MFAEVVDSYYQWKIGLLLYNGDVEEFMGNSRDMMVPSFSLSSDNKKTTVTLTVYLGKITKDLSTLRIKFGLSTGQTILTS